MDKHEIALALKKARKNASMRCAEVSEFIGKSEKTVAAWEQPNGQPDISTLIKLCNIYNFSSLDEMLGLSLDKNLLSSLRVEEKDLIDTYRKLTPNSKQIVTTLAQLELKHIDAVKQAEKPIRILNKTKDQIEAAIDFNLSKKSAAERARLLKVFNQSAAAGYGNYIDDDSFEMVYIPSIPYGTEFGVRISGDSMQPGIHDGDIAFVARQPGIDVGEIGIFICDGDAYCKQLTYYDNTYFLHSLNNKYKDIPILSDSTYTIGKVLGTYNKASATEN